jgi:methylmalonyl-CoA/ethylmalonyl-CoA epimerase
MKMSNIEFWHDHAGVSVPNLDESIAWYEGVLGFTVERRNTIEAIPAEVAILINGSLRLELFQVPGAKPPAEDRSLPNEDLKTFGNKHVSFAAEDVFALADELKARGADIVWVKKFPFGSNLFMRDNAGNLIEFVQRAKPATQHATL